MNPKKFEQRDFMLKQYAKSLSLKETVELTAAKFGCKKQSLYTDWARRPTWLKEICDFQNTDTHIRALVSSFPCLLKHLDDLIENADNSNCRLGAIKLSTETRFRMIELFKDLKAQEREEMRARSFPIQKSFFALNLLDICDVLAYFQSS